MVGQLDLSPSRRRASKAGVFGAFPDMIPDERRSKMLNSTLLVTQVLHVLSGVFWAGELFRPQMGAATVTVITGGVLTYLLHFPGSGGLQERILELGALAAVLAAAVQGALCGSALRQLAAAGGTNNKGSQGRVILGHQIAAGLLALTVTCMAGARYV
jgi:peptidoglycan biosynthesis protein MviN/MurJ (putative lipid II flippase)